MTEENKEVLEEVTEQPKEEVVENKLDESKFESAGNDGVIKIDLSKPPVHESKEVKEKPDEEENAYLVSITYMPDNDVREANLEMTLERT